MVVAFLRDQNEALRANDAFGAVGTGSTDSLPLPFASDPKFRNAAVVPKDTPLVRRLAPSELETSMATGGSNAEVVRSLWELLARRTGGSAAGIAFVPNATVLISEAEEDAEALRMAWGRPSPKEAWASAAVDCEEPNDFRGLVVGRREGYIASSSDVCAVSLVAGSVTGKTDSSGGVGGKSFSTMNLSRRTLPSSFTSTPNGTTGAGADGRFFHSGREKK